MAFVETPGFSPRGRQAPARLGGLTLAAAFALLLAACSSAPPRPAEIRSLRNQAASQLDLANKEADRGNYAGALEQLAEPWRLALGADDPPLLVRVGLARGNVLFCLGRTAEAAELWAAALAEAERAGDPELAAICRVYQARGRLLDPAGGGDAAAIRDQAQAALGSIQTDPLAAALAHTVAGLAEKALGRYAEAEGALQKALSLHLAEHSLELAAYDWYLIASVRSVAGAYDDAAAALDAALELDRRVENTHGIGMDWMARGDVLLRAGKTAEAAAAYERAAAIFTAGGFAPSAAAAESRREKLGRVPGQAE
jgi:tetratricopeptide (TPR) repeat protein